MDFTYKDCQREMDMINRAFCELMIKGDAKGRPFAYPIPTYNIHEHFDWNNKNNNLLWDMTGKCGYHYFANFINSDMKPEDARSMALCGNQNVIFMDKNGRVSIEEIRHLVNTWKRSGAQNYKMLMHGGFVDVIDMFEVPYDKYDNYVSITLDNECVQNFSEQHKCKVFKDGHIQIIESQNITQDDNFLISAKSWGINNSIGTYNSGKIVGYYLAEGWKNIHSNSESNIAINIDRYDIVSNIKDFL